MGDRHNKWGCIAIAFAIVAISSTGIANAGSEDDFLMAQRYHQSGDYVEAARLLHKAVDQGHEVAQLPLAAMYREGQGVRQDYAVAIRLFTRAANAGYPSAQFTLGVMLRAGEGVPQNFPEAVKWYRKAAKQGDEAAQNNLGAMFEYGRGVTENQVTAYMWYELAAKNGSTRGGLNKKRLAKKLSLSDLLKVRKLSLGRLY